MTLVQNQNKLNMKYNNNRRQKKSLHKKEDLWKKLGFDFDCC